jgi:hypothetical protein
VPIAIVLDEGSQLRVSLQPRLDLAALARLLVDPGEELLVTRHELGIPGERQTGEPDQLAMELVDVDDLDLE